MCCISSTQTVCNSRQEIKPDRLQFGASLQVLRKATRLRQLPCRTVGQSLWDGDHTIQRCPRKGDPWLPLANDCREEL